MLIFIRLQLKHKSRFKSDLIGLESCQLTQTDTLSFRVMTDSVGRLGVKAECHLRVQQRQLAVQTRTSSTAAAAVVTTQ